MLVTVLFKYFFTYKTYLNNTFDNIRISNNKENTYAYYVRSKKTENVQIAQIVNFFRFKKDKNTNLESNTWLQTKTSGIIKTNVRVIWETFEKLQKVIGRD